jgi:hypothetical protein
MIKPRIALVSPEGESRVEIATLLRESGYDVLECDELAIASRFAGIVLVDPGNSDGRRRWWVESWIKVSKTPRVVVVSSKPVSWRILALVFDRHLFVVEAPYQVVAALRATPAPLSTGA